MREPITVMEAIERAMQEAEYECGFAKDFTKSKEDYKGYKEVIKQLEHTLEYMRNNGLL